MPSPLEKLKSGLKKQSWQLVSDALFDLTGERIDVDIDKPKRSKKNEVPNFSKQPYSRLLLADNTTSTKSEADERKEASTEQVRVGKRFNMFSDDGTDSVDLRGK